MRSRRSRCVLILAAVVLCSNERAAASGHGPLFGAATPVLSKAYGLAAGIQFPLYRDMRPGEPNERFRFGV